MFKIKNVKSFLAVFLSLFALTGMNVFAGALFSRVADGDYDIICIYVTPSDATYAVELPISGNRGYVRHNQVDQFYCNGQLYSSNLGTSSHFQVNPSLFTALSSLQFMIALPQYPQFTSVVRNTDVDHFNLLSNKLKNRRYGNFVNDSLPFLFVTKRSERVRLKVKVIPNFYGMRTNDGARLVKFNSSNRRQPLLNSGEGDSFVRAVLSAFPDVEETVVSQSQ